MLVLARMRTGTRVGVGTGARTRAPYTESPDSRARGVLVPYEHVDCDREHLIHDSDHRVPGNAQGTSPLNARRTRQGEAGVWVSIAYVVAETRDWHQKPAHEMPIPKADRGRDPA